MHALYTELLSSVKLMARSLCSFVFASLFESQCFSKTFQLSSMKRSFFRELGANYSKKLLSVWKLNSKLSTPGDIPVNFPIH